jgi:hypothetical protein
MWASWSNYEHAHRYRRYPTKDVPNYFADLDEMSHNWTLVEKHRTNE